MNAPNPLARRLLLYGLSLMVVALDQGTKALVVAKIPLHTSIGVVPGCFDLTHVKNVGAAFSLFADLPAPFRSILLNGVAFGVFVAVLIYSLRTSVLATRLQTGLCLILGGAIGNLIDRVRLGCVTDFIEWYLGSYHWPTFNVADSAISVGVCLLALDIWRRPEDEPSLERV